MPITPWLIYNPHFTIKVQPRGSVLCQVHTSSTGNRPDRRATRSARSDPQEAIVPRGERECHLRGVAFGKAASTDSVRVYNETP